MQMRGADGNIYEVPDHLIPQNYPYQRALSLQGGLGQHPQDGYGWIPPEIQAMFTFIPAFYVVSIQLPGTVGGVPTAGSVPLRPEPFLCRRVTWATNGDTPAFVSSSGGATGSAQGRSVTVQWDDEFTKFLGQQPALVSALFGDSQGFLDIPKGVLFQGKQALTITLNRILWPDPDTNPATTQWDFVFQGVGLLPKGIHQSGSAG